jgi:hypothetical protein
MDCGRIEDRSGHRSSRKSPPALTGDKPFLVNKFDTRTQRRKGHPLSSGGRCRTLPLPGERTEVRVNGIGPRLHPSAPSCLRPRRHPHPNLLPQGEVTDPEPPSLGFGFWD